MNYIFGLSLLLGLTCVSPAQGQDDLLPVPTEAMLNRSRSIEASDMVQEGLLTPLNLSEGLPRSCDTGCTDFSEMPAMVESSGTWLRRGFWSAEVDAVIMARQFDRDNKLFTTDGRFSEFATASQIPGRQLAVSGTHPGVEGMARLNLNRFLFRDVDNRDHTAEFVMYGGGQWDQTRRIESLNPNNLFIRAAVGGGNASFNNSSKQEFTLGSTYNSFEMNYRVRERMRRDKMVLEPTGTWVRKASPGITRGYLIGFRYFDLSERLTWKAEGILINAVSESGTYHIATENNLFGVQFGHETTYQTGRWSLGIEVKGGAYVNDNRQRSNFNRTNNAADFATANRGGAFSFVGEMAIRGRYHIRNNFSFRVAYEAMFINSLALAHNQVNFDPTQSAVADTGEVFLHGLSAGFDYSW